MQNVASVPELVDSLGQATHSLLLTYWVPAVHDAAGAGAGVSGTGAGAGVSGTGAGAGVSGTGAGAGVSGTGAGAGVAGAAVKSAMISPSHR